MQPQTRYANPSIYPQTNKSQPKVIVKSHPLTPSYIKLQTRIHTFVIKIYTSCHTIIVQIKKQFSKNSIITVQIKNRPSTIPYPNNLPFYLNDHVQKIIQNYKDNQWIIGTSILPNAFLQTYVNILCQQLCVYFRNKKIEMKINDRFRKYVVIQVNIKRQLRLTLNSLSKQEYQYTTKVSKNKIQFLKTQRYKLNKHVKQIS
eukprot:TRINITY_DN2618_c0_g1_i6.p1 TRINITY_DN2618_c0_g1~~TRINITY_DN2618_c0_g1_i6.p1  ORF type:complete len:202 (+),score=-23.67 TRINITY_DN2618_c0_g1_i6:101-706(+)